MKVSEVETRLEEIRALAHDDEAAHSREDKLWEDVLRAIEEMQCGRGSELARAALDTTLVKFSGDYRLDTPRPPE